MIPGLAETLAILALTPIAGVGPESAPAPMGPTVAAHSETETENARALPSGTRRPIAEAPAPLEGLRAVWRQSGRTGQIRIEQRVYVRIAPRSVSARRNLLAQLPVQPRAQRYEEKKAEKCVPVSQIAGVETGSGNRLLLFLRDREILSVNLEKACRARDFYAGFYVERNKDGKLCVERDTLQSRNGARCDIARMMQLEAIED